MTSINSYRAILEIHYLELLDSGEKLLRDIKQYGLANAENVLNNGPLTPQYQAFLVEQRKFQKDMKAVADISKKIGSINTDIVAEMDKKFLHLVRYLNHDINDSLILCQP